MVYFNNEGFTFTDDVIYSIAKDWIKKRFSHMYKKIFFFIGEGSYDKNGYWTPNMLSEIPKSIVTNIQKDDNAKKIFQKTLLKLEEAKDIKNIDMLWLAHDGHAPFAQFDNPIKSGAVTKIRYLNNSWCDGDHNITNWYPEMKQLRYNTGSIGKNNPFPYQFFLANLLSKGLPIALSESMAKLMHLNFYNNFFNPLASNKAVYLGIKNTVYLYTSWFESYGNNGFSLLEDHKNSDYIFPEFLSLSHKEFQRENFDTDTSYVQKSPVELSALELLLANAFLSTVGKNFLPYKFVITSLNGISFPDFFKLVFRSFSLTASQFIETKKHNTLVDHSFEYSFSSELLENLKLIILNQYKVDQVKDSISNIIATLFGNLENLSLKYFEDTNKLTVALFMSQSLSIESVSIPVIQKILEKLPVKISQIKLSKDLEIKISFDSSHRMILKLSGLSIYTNYLGIVEIPEVIIDLKQGTINYLKNYPVYKIEL
ncbi:MAG: hypothetical protein U0T83_10710 [Bacteriovoracaceae bacterium]